MMAPPATLAPRGDLENLELTVPLHSVDLGLAVLIAVAVAVEALWIGLVLWFAPSLFTVLVPPAMLALVGVAFVPRISDREVLELALTHRTVTLHRVPVGLTRVVALERVTSIDLREHTLVITLPDAELRFWLDVTARDAGPWLRETLWHAVLERRHALDGHAPESLTAMVEPGR